MGIKANVVRDYRSSELVVLARLHAPLVFGAVCILAILISVAMGASMPTREELTTPELLVVRDDLQSLLLGINLERLPSSEVAQRVGQIISKIDNGVYRCHPELGTARYCLSCGDGVYRTDSGNHCRKCSGD
jgi:hypothetical protein